MTLRLIILALLMNALSSQAQISLEHSYTGSTGITHLSVSGYKYFMMDVYSYQCKMYNIDHSVWKTINLAVPSGMYLYDIRHVSENLFNADNKVELCYTYYSYDTTMLFFTYYSKVIDEDGVELLAIPGASYSEVKPAGTAGTKLLAYVYDYSTYPSTMQTQVYTLPGNLPSGGTDFEGSLSSPSAFPNPTTSTITIPYKLPDGVVEGKLQLLGGRGEIGKVFKVDRNFSELRIDVGGFPCGVYHYLLLTDKGISTRGTFIHD